MARRKQYSLSTLQILSLSFISIALLIMLRSKFDFSDKVNLLPNLEIILFSTVFILASFATLAVVLTTLQKRRQLKAISLSGIDKMTGIEFEKYIGELLKSQNYKISFTSTSHDYGVDIIASYKQNKIAVQLKRYSNLVGRSAISDAVAGMAHYKCNKTMVITNNYFTKEAKTLALSNNCKLIDRDKLSEWIYNLQTV